MPPFTALPARLQTLFRWLTPSDRSKRSAQWPQAANEAASLSGLTLSRADLVRCASTGTWASAPPLPAPAGKPPLRGNWPFTVRPPATASSTVVWCNWASASPLTSTQRARPQPAPQLAECATHAPLTVLRRKTGTSRVRLVISGRMADVCAELERMVELEAQQAH